MVFIRDVEARERDIGPQNWNVPIGDLRAGDFLWVEAGESVPVIDRLGGPDCLCRFEVAVGGVEGGVVERTIYDAVSPWQEAIANQDDRKVLGMFLVHDGHQAYLVVDRLLEE
jgi:hypothetical protein